MFPSLGRDFFTAVNAYLQLLNNGFYVQNLGSNTYSANGISERFSFDCIMSKREDGNVSQVICKLFVYFVMTFSNTKRFEGFVVSFVDICHHLRFLKMQLCMEMSRNSKNTMGWNVIPLLCQSDLLLPP